MRSRGSKKLKYIDSLKFDADSSGCMYSSEGSRRSFMAVISRGLDRAVKQVLRSGHGRGDHGDHERVALPGRAGVDAGRHLSVRRAARRHHRARAPDGKKEIVSENGGSPNGLAIGPDGA